MSEPTLEELTKFFSDLNYVKILKNNVKEFMVSYVSSLTALKNSALYQQYVGVDDAAVYDTLSDNMALFIDSNFPQEQTIQESHED